MDMVHYKNRSNRRNDLLKYISIFIYKFYMVELVICTQRGEIKYLTMYGFYWELC